jgi:hypothetical protein
MEERAFFLFRKGRSRFRVHRSALKHTKSSLFHASLGAPKLVKAQAHEVLLPLQILPKRSVKLFLSYGKDKTIQTMGVLFPL